MTTASLDRMTPPLVLRARTAADLMTPDPKSVRWDATVAEAAAFVRKIDFPSSTLAFDAAFDKKNQ